jgi:hypothetical protein
LLPKNPTTGLPATVETDGAVMVFEFTVKRPLCDTTGEDESMPEYARIAPAAAVE